MNTLQDRLHSVFPEHPRGLYAKIARACKIAAPSVSNWFRGESKSMERSNAEAICAAFAPHINPAWLAEGKGQKLAQQPCSEQPAAREARPSYFSEPNNQTSAAYHTFDLLDIQAACGSGVIPSSDHPEVVQRIDALESWATAAFGSNLNRIKLITARGVSMQGTIDHDDLLFVDVGVRHFDGDGIYALLNADGGVQAKRLQRMHTGELTIISDNKQFVPEIISGESLDTLTICGRVLGAWSLKKFW